MIKKIIKFDDAEIEEFEFYQYKSSISIKEIDINKIIASNNFPFSKQDFKYFIGYKDNKKIEPLCIFFLETNAYRIDLDETECMSFLMRDKEFLGKI